MALAGPVGMEAMGGQRHHRRVNGNGGAVGERLEKSWTPGTNDSDYGV